MLNFDTGADRIAQHDRCLGAVGRDHNGTYVLPFPCRRVGNEWWNQTTGQIIEADLSVGVHGDRKRTRCIELRTRTKLNNA